MIRYFWHLFGAVSIAFHLGLIFSGLVPNLVARPLHMALALPWIFIFLAKTPNALRSGILLSLIGVACCVYLAWNAGAISDQYGYLEGNLQYWIAGALITLVLEMARRAIGWPLPLVAAFLGMDCLETGSAVSLDIPECHWVVFSER